MKPASGRAASASRKPAGAAGAASRATAASVIACVVAGESLDRAFAAQIGALPERDHALCRELTFGTLRHYPRLKALLDQLLTKPMRNKDRDIEALALVGLYQLSELRTPAHAAVSATVDAATVLRKRQTAGLLNALLRRYLRESEALIAALSPAAAAGHPLWLWDAIGRHWPGDRDRIVAAANGHPPMTLRVNLSRGERASYQARLEAVKIASLAGQLSPAALTLGSPVDVLRLPGFADGLCSVQDEAAQLAALLLDAQPGERVLDACAAPGGKTGHILELTPTCKLLAMDISPARLERVQANLTRLDLKAELLAGDGASPPIALRDAAPFDAMLVDAPCSATGVIRRHPDIKLLRRSDDAAGFAAQQRALLAGLWPLLAPGGRLLYVTCSLLPEENSEVIAHFLETTAQAVELPLDVTGSHACRHGVQLLPDPAGSDGLYFAMLLKHA